MAERYRVNGMGGSIGIDFVNGKELHVEGCVVHEFVANGSVGIRNTNFNDALHVKDTEIRHNDIGLQLNMGTRGHVDHTRFEAIRFGMLAFEAEGFVQGRSTRTPCRRGHFHLSNRSHADRNAFGLGMTGK